MTDRMDIDCKMVISKLLVFFMILALCESTKNIEPINPCLFSSNSNLKSLNCDSENVPLALSSKLFYTPNHSQTLDGLTKNNQRFGIYDGAQVSEKHTQLGYGKDSQTYDGHFDTAYRASKPFSDQEKRLEFDDRYDESCNKPDDIVKFSALVPIIPQGLKNDETQHLNIVNRLLYEVDDSLLLTRKLRSVTNVQSKNTNRIEAQEVLDLLMEGEEKLDSEFHKDVVLVMGNTGSGKSTFTQFVTGNDEHLSSYETVPNSGDFIIRDISGKISNTSTITSWTVFPELMVDKKTNTKFYDCPGFSDTRGVAHDIAATYFTKEILANANRIKLVFTINYSSVRIGVDRQDFMKFAEHVVTAIKNIDKFNQSIALVVTKVDNQRKKGNLVSDEKVIQSVAGFLKVINAEVQGKLLLNSTAPGVKESYEKIIKFINTLLQENDLYYSRIGIFRRPDDKGPLNSIDLLQNCRVSLEKMVYMNTQYVEHSENDFGYTISAESKDNIHSLIEKLKENIASNVLQITNEMKQNVFLQEEKEDDIQYMLNTFDQAYATFSAIKAKSTRPRDFVKLITKNSNSVDLSMSNKNLQSLVRYDRFLDFFTIFGARTIKPSEWMQDITSLIDNFNDSRNWYRFLNQLFISLTKYNVQRNKNEYIQILDQIRVSENHEEQQFESFKRLLLQKIEGVSDIDYESFKNAKLSKAKINKLESLLKLTLGSKIESFCNKNKRKLTVKGQFILLSNVSTMVKVLCQEVKFLEIFALEKVFVDDDLDFLGKEVQVSIIAPVWEMKGSHKIVLDGTEGGRHVPGKRDQGSGRYTQKEEGVTIPMGPGQDGEPGMGGKPSGSFLGIGQEFIDGQLLSISAIGGKGGPGQDGGDGGNGDDGTVPHDADSSFSWPEQHWCEEDQNSHLPNALGFFLLVPPFTPVGAINVIADGPAKIDTRTCTVIGNSCSDGRNGGNGGVGGKGGKSGQIIVVGMSRHSSVVLNVSDGETGKNGSGGMGGAPGRKGEGRKFKGSTPIFPGIWKFTTFEAWELHECDVGRQGKDGKNVEGIIEPQPNQGLSRPTETINGYKFFARENMDASVRQTNLQMFLDKKLENQDLVNSLYDTLGFIDELNSLESQFFKLKKQFQASSLYKSLLHRITEYAKKLNKNEESKQNIKTLSYLYTATLSKICSIHNNMAEDLVIDLKLFLDSASKDTDRLKESGKIVASNRYFVSYNESLSRKIAEARHFIDEQMSNDLNDILQGVDYQIKGLINETIEQQNIAKEDIIRLNKKKQDLEKNFIWKKVLSVVNVAAMFLGFAGFTGAATVAATGGESMVEENMVLGDGAISNIGNLLSLLPSINEAASQIKNELASKRHSIEDEIQSVGKVLKTLFPNASPEIEEVQKEISELFESFTGSMNTRDILDPASVDEMYKAKDELKGLLNNKTELLGATKSENTTGSNEEPSFANQIENTLDAFDFGTTMLNTLGGGSATIDSLGGTIEGLKTKLDKISQFEQHIYKTIIPICSIVEQNVKKATVEFQGKSHVSLTVSQWQMQRALRDVKGIIQAMTQEFDIPERVTEFISKLEESLSVMIDIYDRIQDYYENAELAAYIANTNSKNAISIDVQDPELARSIEDLQLMIQSNLVLQDYETAFNAFKQHVFPFASFYLSSFELPSLFQPNDTNDLVLEAVNRIEEMKTKLTHSSHSSINHDRYLHTNVLFNSKSRNMPPFFSWKHKANANIIKKLLEGKEVTVKADITQGLEENAVKFNEVGIRFKLLNTTLQQELDEKLLDFKVTMTHFGHAYYRCDNKFYVITSPRQVISYSFAKHENGDPEDKNAVMIS